MSAQSEGVHPFARAPGLIPRNFADVMAKELATFKRKPLLLSLAACCLVVKEEQLPSQKLLL